MKKILLLLAVASVAISTSQAQSVFSNAITDTNPSLANPFTAGQSVSAGLSASGIGRGSGLSANSAGDRYNATSWSLVALDTSDYFTFTLTPNSGFQLDLSSFTYTGQRSGTGPSSFAFRSSLDGFTLNLGNPATGGATIDLSSSLFQGITTPIEFRFYGWGGTNVAGTYSINGFTFSGAVSEMTVPEPSTVGLLGLGLLGLYGSRMRRRGATV